MRLNNLNAKNTTKNGIGNIPTPYLLIAIMFRTLFPEQMSGTRNIITRLQVVTVVSGNPLYIIFFIYL